MRISFRKFLVPFFLVLLPAPVLATGQPATVRVDYYHGGNADFEMFSLHQVVVEPLPWPGNMHKLLDTTGRGYFMFQVEDPESGEVLYSRGFSSIFQEWQSTGEAAEMNRSFHESLRFPKPEQPVLLRILKRNEAQGFDSVWTADIDTGDMLVVRAHAPVPVPVQEIHVIGPPPEKVDLVLLGDGYTAAEADKFLADANRLTAALFTYSPFKERADDFNVWAINPPAIESGVNRPSNGTFRFSPSGTTYDAFRAERYVLAFDNLGMRRILQNVPYEFIIVLGNSETYGGGGIFGLYSTVAAGSDWPEPWEPNITALHDPAALKWSSLVKEGTAVPTGWPKEEFEAFQRENQARRAQLRAENRPESEMNQLFADEQAWVNELFAGYPETNSVVGAFEGANYQATGYYRSEMNCTMFTRHDRFCRVCSDALEQMMDLYTSDGAGR